MKKNFWPTVILGGLGILVMGLLGVVMVAVFASPQPSTVADEGVRLALLPPPATIICGPFATPGVVMGIPVAVSDSTITFDDGYLLRLKDTPSLFLNKRGAFQMQDGLVTAYLLGQNGAALPVGFNPCPQAPAAKP